MRVKAMLQEPCVEFSDIQDAFLDISEQFPDFHQAGFLVKQLRPRELAVIGSGIGNAGFDESQAVVHAFRISACEFPLPPPDPERN